MQKADSALDAIPTPADRDAWLKLTTAYKAAGGDYEHWDAWSAKGDSYNQRANRDTWKSITPDGGITEATLYGAARENGWTDQDGGGDWHTHTHSASREARKAPARKPAPLTPAQAANVEQYIAQAQAGRDQIAAYCKGREFNDETIERFKLGYDAAEKRLVIPYPGAAYYVTRSMTIAPNGERKDKEPPKYKYPTKAAAGDKPVFNLPALTGGAEAVAITEGQIDAITLEQYGTAAIAATEPDTVLAAIYAAGDAITARAYLVIPDADAPGAGKAEKMRDALNAAGLAAYIYPLPGGYHDANDMAIKAGADLWDWTRNAGGFIAERKRAALAEYCKISGAERMPALRAFIEQSASRPVISTGYPTLDLELGDGGIIPGGLTAGLYTIGAISSLGKTTFAMQIADSIAASGRDVLVIALEMSAFELMAKSISRLTVDTAGADSERKTVQGILQGTRYPKYSPEEARTIQEAEARYTAIAKHVFIVEGIGTIGAAQIRETVKWHYQTTGRAPVVIVDYLQILAPADPRATDKANTDAAVLEMKRISRDYSIPVVCISSFNRSNYANRVSMEALKESGAIEYSSDVVIGLQLEGAGTKDFDVDAAKSAEPRKIEAVILKNRSGKTGQTIPFEYEARFNLFRDVKQGHRFSPEDAGAIRAGNLADIAKGKRRL
ncbi:MAG: DnaB-like helicase C-terminal domain-containing protein [Oscillospiraceae bacterium]|nr:DnaB-like helicase C-terminal domain-containing protein [Oscillospiraceae bacterium]